MNRIILIACLLGLVLNFCSSQKIGGITVVAPPKPVDEEAFIRVKKTNANWVSFVPFGYHREGESQIKYNIDWQWWGEKKVGITKCIRHAKDKGLKVMVKPQVYIPGSWVGDMDFESEEEWSQWENSYKEFINFFLDIAITESVDMFCLGTEYKIAIIKREKFWRSLIKSIRERYDGKLVYSSNWDNYQNVPFWEELDFIGISAYFPLTDEKTPSLKTLGNKWDPIKKELRLFSNSKKKNIIFTEYGYLSIDKCAYKAWELEKVIRESEVNQNAQANAFTAILTTFQSEKWWEGGFIWKWFPEGQGHEGYPEKDYTPQDKKAEQVIKVFYNQMDNMIIE